jgi:hypothetical protein
MVAQAITLSLKAESWLSRTDRFPVKKRLVFSNGAFALQNIVVFFQTGRLLEDRRLRLSNQNRFMETMVFVSQTDTPTLKTVSNACNKWGAAASYR